MQVRLSDATWAEWSKFRNLRLPLRLMVSAILLAAVSAVVLVLSFPVTRGEPLADAEIHDILTASALGIDVAAVTLVVLAAWFVGIEFHDNALATGIVLVRRRASVLLAKSTVIAAVAVLVGLIVASLVTIIGIALATVGTQEPLAAILGVAASGELLRMLAGSILMPVSFALFAVFGAFCFRSTAGGVLSALAIIIGSMLAAWLPGGAAASVQPLLPLAAVHTISGVAEVGSSEYSGVLGAASILAVWLCVTGFIARWRLRILDI